MRRITRWVGMAAGAVAWTASVASWVGISVSAVASVGFATWAWASQWGSLPVALVALGTFTAFIWAYNGVTLKRTNSAGSGRVPTLCRLVFAPDGQPTAVQVVNIKRWFALHNEFQWIDKEGKDGKVGTTILFMTFEEAVSIKQVHVRGQGAALPRWEIKDRDPWQIIIVFSGSLAGVLIDVDLEI